MEESFQKQIEKFTPKDYKAPEKHIELSEFIKKVHNQLRESTKESGVESAWNEHLGQKEILKNYAKSMHELATTYWEKSNQYDRADTHCRIEWIKTQCRNYFFENGKKRFDDKENYLIEKCNKENNSKLEKIIYQAENLISLQKLNILDVGSCYNPFKDEELFSVTAIDIAPYSKDVIECDFLNVHIGNSRIFSNDKKSLIQIEKNFYDAVIFSLLLEYIPCPVQRFLCCKKAYELLKVGGVLFIITPDSKHIGANAKIINTSWKVVLAKIGFLRVRYEKFRHIHCLMFRKCSYKEVSIKDIHWEKIPMDEEIFSSEKVFIPQDFQNQNQNEDIARDPKQYKHNDKELLELFQELPCFN